MKQFNKGDVAVVTGPLRIAESGTGRVYLGEVVDIVIGTDEYGDVRTIGRSSFKEQYIDSDSLTSYDEVVADLSINWGEIHDYVYPGGDDDE
jgi:hypothetical protein